MYLSHGFGAVSPGVSSLIDQAAARYGVPSSLASAVASKESGFNQAAVGSSGEVGVFQLMPGTAAQLGVNPADLSQNVDGGVRYLSQLYGQFGDWGTALEAYNGGPGNVTTGTVSGAAQQYSADVLAAAGLSDSSGYDFSTDGTVPADSSEAFLSIDSLPSTPILVGLGVLGLLALAFAVSR